MTLKVIARGSIYKYCFVCYAGFFFVEIKQKFDAVQRYLLTNLTKKIYAITLQSHNVGDHAPDCNIIIEQQQFEYRLIGQQGKPKIEKIIT